MAYCEDCGTEYNTGTKFCPGCGKKIGEEISASETQRYESPKKNSDNNRPGAAMSVISFVLVFVAGIAIWKSAAMAIIISVIAFVLAIVAIARRCKVYGLAIAAIILSISTIGLGMLVGVIKIGAAGVKAATEASEEQAKANRERYSANAGYNSSGRNITTSPSTKKNTAPVNDEDDDSDSPAVADSGAVNPELKAFLDEYEAVMNKYIDFMAKYMKNPTDMTLLSEYATVLEEYEKYAKAVEKYDADKMSAADAAYYLEVTARVYAKMNKLLGSTGQ